MLITAVLFGYAALLGGLVDRALTRAAWVIRSPRAALWAWHACAGAFLLSIVGVLVLTAHDMWEYAVVRAFHAAEAEIHAVYAGDWHVELIADAALLLLLLAIGALAVLAVRRARAVGRERSRHRLVTDALADPSQGDRDCVRILDHPAPAAFCIPGSARTARVVLTRGTLRLLNKEQIDATVAHERAHLRFRHHQAILLADVLHAAVGWSGALAHYARQVRRLAEMTADDHAAQRHGHRTVASALLDMCTASDGGPDGSAVLPMTGPDPAERIRRLISASSGAVGRIPPLLVAGAAAAALALPPALALAPAATLAGSAHCAAYTAGDDRHSGCR
ncbi:M56 family metallopeptidase [Streptomyces sp. CdTB01]|uniref:M56 family metallopeptidase n=1 Tax=Streptomyces sp. CdTB01 TaxID=1725411 RepID=UPI00073A9642|nr:M56 family metallopeptidase [Streptomyces sp. CdTB01]ALV33113.1 hypothetical protein AS200_14450 [Streptomyces sp. CdTB01]